MDEKPDNVSGGLWASILSILRPVATSIYTRNIVHWMSGSSLSTASLIKIYENPSKRVERIPNSVPHDESTKKAFIASERDGEHCLEQLTTSNNSTNGPHSSFLTLTTSEENPISANTQSTSRIEIDKSNNEDTEQAVIMSEQDIEENLSKPMTNLGINTDDVAPPNNEEEYVPLKAIQPLPRSNEDIICPRDINNSTVEIEQTRQQKVNLLSNDRAFPMIEDIENENEDKLEELNAIVVRAKYELEAQTVSGIHAVNTETKLALMDINTKKEDAIEELRNEFAEATVDAWNQTKLAKEIKHGALDAGPANWQPAEVNVITTEVAGEVTSGNGDPEITVPKEINNGNKDGINKERGRDNTEKLFPISNNTTENRTRDAWSSFLTLTSSEGPANWQPAEVNVITTAVAGEVIPQPINLLQSHTSVEADCGNHPEITGEEKKDIIVIHSDNSEDIEKVIEFIRLIRETCDNEGMVPQVTVQLLMLDPTGESTFQHVGTLHDRFRWILIFVTENLKGDRLTVRLSETATVLGLDAGGDKKDRVVPVWVNVNRKTCQIPHLQTVSGINYKDGDNGHKLFKEQIVNYVRLFRGKYP